MVQHQRAVIHDRPRHTARAPAIAQLQRGAGCECGCAGIKIVSRQALATRRHHKTACRTGQHTAERAPRLLQHKAVATQHGLPAARQRTERYSPRSAGNVEHAIHNDIVRWGDAATPRQCQQAGRGHCRAAGIGIGSRKGQATAAGGGAVGHDQPAAAADRATQAGSLAIGVDRAARARQGNGAAGGQARKGLERAAIIKRQRAGAVSQCRVIAHGKRRPPHRGAAGLQRHAVQRQKATPGRTAIGYDQPAAAADHVAETDILTIGIDRATAARQRNGVVKRHARKRA
ncbi:hypothetical protein GLUCOINTEAF2_0203016 [Komagataeibacter intermedius AF2]|uniref:Uncharacterized protein n=1 Tax=Komagataeibacter intermedius AF2 TaxID=1458464 RepID=A0A0N1FA70_9PROT|nr:hypothetical protein GLUCOINTEAF2_0203016 [Komagataeibacter intermedius AF2]